MPDLEKRLGATRARLLDEISPPDLATISVRATTLRRRRRAGRAGAVVLAFATAAVLAWHPWLGRVGGGTAPQPATTRAATPTLTPALVYTEAGITVNGLTSALTELAGTVEDAEFVDPDRGWVLAADCGPDRSEDCHFTVAGTADGGLTWRVHPVTGTDPGPVVPDLITLGPETVGLYWPDGTARVSTDGGTTWTVLPTATASGGPQKADGEDRVIVRGGTGACLNTAVEVWHGSVGRSVRTPPIDACWAAPTRAADGGWWVGGSVNGVAAAAVTYDGGTSWEPHTFDGAGTVRLATLGAHVYAAVVDRNDKLLAIYHSADRGATFTRTWRGNGQPPTLRGDLVPLLDNRLLLADRDGRWFVSDDRGATFDRLVTMAQVGRIVRTPGGYIAYDVVAAGFTAYSADGATWRKLHVH